MSDNELDRKRIERRLARLEAEWRRYSSHDETEQAFEDRIAQKRAFAREMLERFPGQFCVHRGGEDFFHYSPSIADAWLPIFVKLCEGVDAALREHPSARFRWNQVKEKFGGLRLYATVDDHILRPAADPSHPGQRTDAPLLARLRELFRLAIAEAENTCETCGRQPARLYSFGWWTTLCREHFRERKKRDREERAESIPRRREDLELLRARIRAIAAERRAALEQLDDDASPERLTPEALRRLVPVRDWGGRKYVRLADIPEPTRGEFAESLLGSTVPGIPGESPDDVAYGHDWHNWLEGCMPGWGRS